MKYTRLKLLGDRFTAVCPCTKNGENSRTKHQILWFTAPLVLTGGDPLKRTDIYSLIEYAVQKRIEVAITPFATPLVTNEAIRRLQDAGISRIAISLDGADAATHDSFRGMGGSYARTWQILDMVQDLGVPAQVNTTLTPRNFDQLDIMAEQLEKTRIVLWSAFFLVPVGRATDQRRLTDEQYEEAFAQLWRHSLDKPYRIKTTEAPHYRRFVLQQLRNRGWKGTAPQGMHRPINRWSSLGINDGKGIIFISHTGLIYPSGFLPVVCGRFPADDVVRVYQHAPVFRLLCDAHQLKGKCGICEYRHICGGSRARAYAVSGQLMAEEPDCIYQPAQLV